MTRLNRLAEANQPEMLVCRDCGARTPMFRGWAFCCGLCKGDATVKLQAYHDWAPESQIEVKPTKEK